MNRNGKRKGRRFLSMLLVLAVLLSGNGMSAFARGVSGNDVPLDESQVPQNPVHHCNPENREEDTTEWSYVYFGSYPQSEVTDEGMQKEIDAAITVSGNLADEGMDVWVNGTKYRRISKIDTENNVWFDDVPNNGYRYFKWERIKWRVLENDGSTLFVVADKAIDCKDYNGKSANATWETSTIRNWLNTSFYSTAFSSSEQGAIVTQNVVNEDSLYTGIEGGNNTSDNIYLLSISEVTNETYGFCSDYGTEHLLIDYSMSRRMKISDYANARGEGSAEEGCCWWLRSLGGMADCAASVDGGYVYPWGLGYGGSEGVCPALHINFSSGIWSMVDDGTSGEGGNGGGLIGLLASKTKSKYEQGEQLNLNDLTVTAVYKNSNNKVLEEGSYTIDATGIDMNKPGTYMLVLSYTENGVTTTTITITVKAKNGGNIQSPGGNSPQPPVHYCNTENGEEDTAEWSYVYFGSYPQSEVTDEGIQKEIDAAITVSGNLADAGMDVCVNGTKYRRISKTDTSRSRYFNNVPNKGYRYFKWERIKWKVLNNDGKTLFVVADRAVDCKDYNEEVIDTTWETSTIRSWLNNSFYNTAFNSSEQGAIVMQNIVNEDNPEYGIEGGNNTSDNIYLLSISEVTNETYGFCSDYSTDSASRWVQPSNYAHARGVSTYNSSDSGGNDNCFWWLRSPGCESDFVACVRGSGDLARSGIIVNYTVLGDTHHGLGICPALHINLSSGIWSMVDDGTSGEGGNGGNTQNPGGNIPQPGKDTPQSDGNTQNQPIKVTKLTITAPSKKLAAGKKVKLTLKAEPENALDKTVTWKTSNAKYATVDKNGKVSLKAAGAGKTVTITATANDGSGKKATVRLKIMKHAVKSIKLKASGKTMEAGKSMAVKATVKTTGSNANKTLKWSSSNTKYATVSKSGKVTAKKAGKGKTVTITATATDGSNKKAKVKIQIK